MPTTPAPSAALAARPATAVPSPPRRRSTGLRRLAAAALAAAWLGLAGPAAADEPARARPRAEPARGGGALLLLSFLVPLPLSMALVTSPQATHAPRPPPDPCTGSRRQPGCVAARSLDAR